jgi:hypothetical protein
VRFTPGANEKKGVNPYSRCNATESTRRTKQNEQEQKRETRREMLENWRYAGGGEWLLKETRAGTEEMLRRLETA